MTRGRRNFPNEDNLSVKFLDVRVCLAGTVTEKHRLEKKAAIMQTEIEKMEKELLRLESQLHARIPGEFIITFVKGINKALQYYEYLAYLRTCDFVNLENIEEDILKQLAKEQEEVEEPNRVSEQLIQDCLDTRILELRGARAWKIHQFIYGRYLKKHRVKNVESIIQAMYPDLKNVKAENVYLLTDPISTIVFKTIEKESSVAEALEEYSCFHSKYGKYAIAADIGVEKYEVDNSGMPDTILLGQLSVRMMTPFPAINSSNIAEAGQKSDEKKRAKNG